MAVKDRGSVYSLRFNEQDLALLKSLADREDMPISDLVREAVRTLANTQKEPTVEVTAPAESRVYIYRGGPDQSRTTATKAVIKVTKQAKAPTTTFAFA